MFDYIECEYKLPLPDFTKEESADLNDVKWEEVEFQTKDFYDLLIKYTISEDGQLYENKIERQWVEDEGSPMGAIMEEKEDGIEKMDYSGDLAFYGMILGKKYDHWFEFKSLWWKGELKEIDLLKYKKEDNTERLEAQEKFDSVLRDFSNKKERWWFPIYSIYRKLITIFFGAIRWVVGFIAKITWKIERWLP
ncbi:hypothetical protein CMI37_34465 [Candidatus Pacearchaeota archaeon]|nr:hypothetical protein [Candidatus Pacearchaeota archaeon]